MEPEGRRSARAPSLSTHTRESHQSGRGAEHPATRKKAGPYRDDQSGPADLRPPHSAVAVSQPESNQWPVLPRLAVRGDRRHRRNPLFRVPHVLRGTDHRAHLEGYLRSRKRTGPDRRSGHGAAPLHSAAGDAGIAAKRPAPEPADYRRLAQSGRTGQRASRSADISGPRSRHRTGAARAALPRHLSEGVVRAVTGPSLHTVRRQR